MIPPPNLARSEVTRKRGVPRASEHGTLREETGRRGRVAWAHNLSEHVFAYNLPEGRLKEHI